MMVQLSIFFWLATDKYKSKEYYLLESLGKSADYVSFLTKTHPEKILQL